MSDRPPEDYNCCVTKNAGRLRPRTPWPTGMAAIAFAFTLHRVPYSVIGGAAAACYLSDRSPADLDVVISPTVKAGNSTMNAIGWLNAHSPRIGLADRSDAEFPPLSIQAIISGREDTYETGWGKLHLVGASLPSSVDRAAIVNRSSWWLASMRPVAICRLRDLIDIKTEVGRPIDLDDVSRLQSVMRPT